jgi:nucleotide-binding universal stress UspA family protein
VGRLANFLAPGAHVSLVRASELAPVDFMGLINPEARSSYLKHLEKELQGPQHLDFRVVDGEAAESILAFAEQERSDLIAMATHGYGGLKHFLIGSVTEKVARHAPCCVLAFPPGTY